VLPSWNRLLYGTSGPYGTGFRKSAHTTENVNGIDLVGGWYDAGGEHSAVGGLRAALCAAGCLWWWRQ
jgi:hypothetical protein